MPLSDTAIKQAKPKEKPYKLYDAGGLFLIVTPQATSKGGNGGGLNIVLMARKKLCLSELTPTLP